MASDAEYQVPDKHKLIASKLTEFNGQLYWDAKPVAYKAELSRNQRIGIICGAVGGIVAFLAACVTIVSIDTTKVKKNVCSYSIARRYVWFCPDEKAPVKPLPAASTPPKSSVRHPLQFPRATQPMHQLQHVEGRLLATAASWQGRL